MAESRRDFLKIFGAGISGSILARELSSFDNMLASISEMESDSTEIFWRKISRQFEFEKGLKYFNNGSLGACPLPVQEATNAYRKTLDSFPSKYMWGGWKGEIEETRSNVAELFSVSSEEIALIHNTTEGMNLIARSFDLEEGDEVILADHEHTSGSVCWQIFQESKGVVMVRPELPLMPSDPEEIVEAYRQAITPRTKVISMCHIVNTNGMILPIKQISELAHKQGIYVAVDGAQGAGMINIDFADLGCDFYAVSAHKWLFAPKGIGILYAKKESQEVLNPLIVCRGHSDKSIRRLENYNTRNLPELLGLGAAIAYHNSIGSQKIHDRTYELKKYFRSAVSGNPKLKLKTPEHDDISAGIQLVEILGMDVKDVRKTLTNRYNIDCRPMTKFNLNAVRISLAIFCTKKDIDELVDALNQISRDK